MTTELRCECVEECERTSLEYGSSSTDSCGLALDVVGGAGEVVERRCGRVELVELVREVGGSVVVPVDTPFILLTRETIACSRCL